MASLEVRRAAVIDDAFDQAPMVEELDAGDWSVFIDDFGRTTGGRLGEVLGGHEGLSASEMRGSSEFVAELWRYRSELPVTARATLFGTYENTMATESRFLDDLVERLRVLGLECELVGRDPRDAARAADLIFVDLFLGRQQSEADVEAAISQVSYLTEDRNGNPPLVVLMSRSGRVFERRNEFRDRAGLISSTFRVVRKAELEEEGRLETVLRRLADSYKDSLRLARFVAAWDDGLERARNELVKTLRSLDLADLAQMRFLLLEHEGEDVGGYLLDLAERVLQHAVEDDEATTAAAKDLNGLELATYQAPHLVGSPDVQDLAYRMAFMHPRRLMLSDGEEGVELRFGDLLRWRDSEGGCTQRVSLVLSPACDLVRGEAEDVVLLEGVLRDLSLESWSYRPAGISTAIVVLPCEERKWIQWNLRKVRTWAAAELRCLTDANFGVKRIGRLREVFALQIQQAVLARLGRIGLPAKPPAPFAVSLALFWPDADGAARAIDVAGVESAACYAGRDRDSESVYRLVVSEECCDGISRSMRQLRPENVLESAREGLLAVQEDSELWVDLERGRIEVDFGKKEKLLGERHVAVVTKGDFVEGGALKGNLRKAILILRVLKEMEE